MWIAGDYPELPKFPNTLDLAGGGVPDIFFFNTNFVYGDAVNEATFCYLHVLDESSKSPLD